MHALSIAAVVVFWGSLGLMVYAYLAYPALVWAASRLFGRRDRPEPLAGAALPFVSMLIAAHNEEDVIAARIHNALATDYPRDRLEVVIASDGSSDRTNAIVREAMAQSTCLRLIEYPQRGGKVSVLNRSIPQLRGDIVVLSDANTYTEAGAVRRLVAWFSRPEVGAVCGRLSLVDRRDGRNADGLYWRFENFLKTSEGRLGGLLGANGAIYAIRRRLFEPVPADTLVDDFVIPLSIKLRTGCEIVYEPDATAVEETGRDLETEFRRRARIGTGGFQCISRLWPLLNPTRGWLALAFLSHKVLRWFGPFVLIALLAANALLLDVAFYRRALVLQAIGYLCAVVGRAVPGGNLFARVARLPALFASVNLALLVGFWRWLRQPQQKGVWERTGR